MPQAVRQRRRVPPRAMPEMQQSEAQPLQSDAQPLMATAREPPPRPFQPAEADAEMAGALVEAEEGEAEERTCVVCLADPIETIAFPCRHSVLCRDCMEQVKRSSGRCPICRAHIDASVRGIFHEEFVDLTPDVIAALRKPLAQAQAVLYESMYDNVRVLLLIGAASAAGAVACFLVPPLPLTGLGVVLAGGAIAIGYLPWLAVSISAFEQGQAAGGDAMRARLFSSEDLQRPAVLVTKGAVLLVGAPIALAVFFAPYALYAGVVRPFGRHVLPHLISAALRGLLHSVCYSYMYVFRPLGTAVWWSGRAIAYVVSKAFEGTCWCCKTTGAGIGYAARFTWDRALVPIGQACYNAGDVCYTHALVPMGQGLAHGATAAGSFLHQWVLLPCWHALAWSFDMLGRGCVAAVRSLYDYVLEPCSRGIAKGSVWLFINVIQPTGSAAWKAISYAAHGVAKAACCVAAGLAKAAGAVFVYVLAPTGKGIAFVAAKVAEGLAVAARGFYAYVLAPVGTAVAACGGALWTAVAAACSAAGRCIGVAAGAVAMAATAAYEHVLAPVGRAVAVCAVAVKDQLLSPLASLLVDIGRMVADACRAAAAGARDFGGWLGGVSQEAWMTIREAVHSVSQAFNPSSR